MTRAIRWLTAAIVVVAAAAIGLTLFAAARGRPQDLPWTALDLARPIGLATGRELTALGDDAPLCRSLLARAGVPVETVATPRTRNGCGYRDGVRLRRGGAEAIAWAPAGVTIRCAVAASLAVWEWEVVQPAAVRRLGTTVTAIDHFGSYSCRRIAGGRSRGWSEHATANAIDVAGFRLADGRRITVAADWRGTGARGVAEAAFLHDVRDGACQLFATVLSPDYNAAHRDHLHLDQAARGSVSWRACL